MRKPLFVLLVAVLVSTAAWSQMTIMNVPSADVTDKGHVYFRADSFYQGTPALYSFNGNFAVGLGHNFEVDLNGMNLTHPNYQSAVVPGFKWALYKGEKLTLYVGDQVTIPVTNKAFSKGNFVYAAGAYSVGSKTRLTAGVWNSQNTMSFTGTGNHSGAMGGIEYTAKTFKNGGSIVPTYDWSSGNGYNGYSSFGVMFYPTKKLMILPAYDVGNANVGNGNHFAALFVGYLF